MSTNPNIVPESLYAAYLRERRGVSTLATDDGFITYHIDAAQGGCYIQDIYVRPEKRWAGLASELADLVAVEANRAGCHHLYGTCVPSTPGSTVSLRAMLAYGFQLYSAGQDLIVLHKDI